jgi:lysosomal alpha-mannosidase
MDKLMKYINSHPEYNMKLIYSTPSIYLDAVNSKNVSWSVFNYDFFPYADDAHSYWSGYFTSRATLKGYIRSQSNFLQATQKLFTLSHFSINIDEQKALEDIKVLSQAFSVAQHHDAVAGTGT